MTVELSSATERELIVGRVGSTKNDALFPKAVNDVAALFPAASFIVPPFKLMFAETETPFESALSLSVMAYWNTILVVPSPEA